MESARFEIVDRLSTEEFLVIRDLGPWHRFLTVTNDVENVVAKLIADAKLPGERRLLYIDSHGDLDEIAIEKGRFYKFMPIGQTTRAAVMRLI